jgi:transposase
MAQHERLTARIKAIQAYHDCNCDVKAAANKLYKQGVLKEGQQQFVRRWVRRAEAGEPMQDGARSGRPSQLSEVVVDRARHLLTKERFSCAQAAIAVKAEGLCQRGVSASTIRRAVRSGKAAIVFKNPRKVPLLTQAQKDTRLRFARRNRRRGWGNVMFSDSKCFRLGPAPGNSGNKKWMLKGNDDIVTVVKFPPSIHAYAGVTKYGKTDLIFSTGTTWLKNGYEKANRGVRAEEYVESVLKKGLIPQARAIFGRQGIFDWELQQDGARAHTAKQTLAFLQQEGIKVLPEWPPNSPDLSWIENLWGIVDNKLRKQNYANFDEFCGELRRIWNEIPIGTLQNLQKTMRKRVQTCIERKGEHVGY